ncbi:hypothetical protein ACFLU3_00745 [Chloroflexota bacterium]
MVRLKWWTKRRKLDAVYDSDLEHFLSSIGVLKQIKAGAHQCVHCNSIVTLENLGAIYPISNDVSFVCDRPSCLNEIDILQEEWDG